MTTPQPSRGRHWLDGWREWRRARNQQWMEKQAAKRLTSADEAWKDVNPGRSGLRK